MSSWKSESCIHIYDKTANSTSISPELCLVLIPSLHILGDSSFGRLFSSTKESTRSHLGSSLSRAHGLEKHFSPPPRDHGFEWFSTASKSVSRTYCMAVIDSNVLTWDCKVTNHVSEKSSRSLFDSG